MKKLRKILLWGAGAVVIFILLLTGFTQTPMFRTWLRSTLLSVAENELNGRLSLGGFHGNIFTGLTIDSAAIDLDGTRIIGTGTIELRYNPLRLFSRTIAAGSVVISRPEIRLLRGRDGIWNIDKLAKKKSTTPPGPFRYTVDVGNLEIRNASFLMYDSTKSPTTPETAGKRIDYSHIAIDNLGIRLTATISSIALKANISDIHFAIPEAGIELKKFSAVIAVDTTHADIRNLVITTAGSSIGCTALLQKINIMKLRDLADLEHAPVSVQFNSPRVDFEELKKFLPSLSFFDGQVAAQTTIRGEFGDFDIESMSVAFGGSHIRGAGRLRHLHRPADLFIDAAFDDCIINPGEAVDLMPGLPIPDYGHLGPLKCSVEYHGEPLDFRSATHVTTLDAGSADAEMSMNLRTRPVKYSASLRTRNINAGKIFGIPSLDGALSASAEFQGEGFRLDELNTDGTADIDSSTLFRLPLDKTHISIQARPNSIETSTSISLGSAELTAVASIVGSSTGLDAYTLDAECSGLDLEEFLHRDRYESSLHFVTHVRGSATSIDDATGRLDFIILPSSIRKKNLDPRTITLELDQHDPHNKEITLSSNVADATMRGQFAVSRIGSVIAEQIRRIGDAIAAKLFLADSALGLPPILSHHTHTRARTPGGTAAGGDRGALEQGGMINMDYVVQLKDLSPIALFLDATCAARGSFKGFFTGSNSDMLVGGDYQVENVVYADSSHRYLLNKGVASFEVDHITPDNTVDSMRVYLQMSASDLYLGALRLTDAKASIRYRQQAGTFSMRGTVDSVMSLDMGGRIAMAKEPYILTIENLLAGYRGYDWELPSAVAIPFDTTQIVLPKIRLTHGRESIVLQGSLMAGGRIDGSLAVENLDLKNSSYFTGSGNGSGGRVFAGTINASAAVTGTLEQPGISSHARVTNLTYGDARLGTFDGRLDYRDGVTNVDAAFSSRRDTAGGNKTDFLIRGKIPLNLAFTGVENRYSTGEFDLDVNSKDFKLDILNPFISVLDSLTGKLDCSLHIGGTATQPLYIGSITVDSVHARFLPNNMRYWISGKFEPQGDSIAISGLTIRNDAIDRTDGLVSITGAVRFHGLTIDHFDLSAGGALQILSTASRRSMSTVYGPLLARIGDAGLHLTGTPGNSLLSGTVELQKAVLVFPPSREQYSYNASEDLVQIVYVEDTLNMPHNQADSVYYATLESESKEALNRAVSSEHASAFLRGLKYDLRIRTAGQVSITMMFTPVEELSANLSGEITVEKIDGEPRFVGEIEVGNQSRYKFFKDFTASGTLKFTGPFDNPQLDIQASYSGELRATDSTSATKWVVVTLKITGTRKTPNVSFDLTVNGIPETGDVQTDAVSFILYGQFAQTQNQADRYKNTSAITPQIYSSLISGLSSSVLAGPITEFLRNNVSPAIQSAEVALSSESLTTPEVRLIASVGPSVWRYNGRINDFGNGNVSIEAPVGRILDIRHLNDLVLEFERRVDMQTATYSTKWGLTNNLRLFYRFTF